MAEIRSTLDMVMERAAKMAANAEDQPQTENKERAGMKLAAEFLNGKTESLAAQLAGIQGKEQKELLSGICNILLRNITLPRDGEISKENSTALTGILEVGGGLGLETVCQELQQIMEQYGQHKEQTIQQLEDAMKAQLEQQATAQGQHVDTQINPKLHPQYQEEMGKALSDLNDQYTQALDQRKETVKQQLLQ